MRTLFHLTLTLRGEHEKHELAALAALKGAATHLDGVILALPHYASKVDCPELPRAFRNAAQDYGLAVTVGRRLWPAWQDQQLVDAYDPVYYAAVLAELKGYAAGLGTLVTTCLDCEPYGTNPIKPSLKLNGGLDDLTAAGIRQAISAVLERGLQADYSCPGFSGNKHHYCYAFGGLGIFPLQNKTYRQIGPEAKGVASPSSPAPLTSWGTHVTTRREILAKPLGKRPLSVAEWAGTKRPGLDRESLQKCNPKCDLLWLYVNHSELVKVLHAISELGDSGKDGQQ